MASRTRYMARIRSARLANRVDWFDGYIRNVQRIAIVNHNSAMKREADGEQINGYKTIHYSIDTARFNATELQILGPTMGPGGFEKGDCLGYFRRLSGKTGPG